MHATQHPWRLSENEEIVEPHETTWWALDIEGELQPLEEEAVPPSEPGVWLGETECA